MPPGQLIDLTGMKFARLTVLRKTKNTRGVIYWDVICECGKTKRVKSQHLREGKIRSCGCLQQETRGKANFKHGASMPTHPDYKLFVVWKSMIQRCTDTNSQDYPNYGGRGITIHSIWLTDFIAYRDYIKALPNYGVLSSLDRIDNDGNYIPGNLRWADLHTQARNKSNVVFVHYNNKLMPLVEACELAGISPDTVRARRSLGWKPEDWFNPLLPHGHNYYPTI